MMHNSADHVSERQCGQLGIYHYNIYCIEFAILS